MTGPPTRVFYCTDTYTPQVNGVSVVTALSVIGLQERRWMVGVVAPAYPSAPLPGVKIFLDDWGSPDVQVDLPSVAFPPYLDIRLAAPLFGRVSRAIEAFKPDIVHCATEFIIGRMGQIAAHRARIPVVTSYHTDFSRYAEAYGARFLRPPVSRYLTRFHRRALRTYTPSLAAADDLRRLGVHHVEVWGRAVDTVNFAPSRADARLRRRLVGPDDVCFVHVGRLAPEKDVRVLLDAIRIARAEPGGERLHLVIAGGGPEERALRAMAPEGVNFLGILDRTTHLPRLYASADAFVFASTTETLGLVVLEAMASGLPVIAPAAGGVADHLRDGENGLVVPPRDPAAIAKAMLRVAASPELRAHLAQGARWTAEGLSWQGELNRLAVSYLEVCQLHAASLASRHEASPNSALVRSA